jgi:hypothetical protein
MKIKNWILVLFFVIPTLLFANDYDHEPFHWDEKPVIHKLDSIYDKESAVIIEEFYREEYIYNDHGGIDNYKTVHKIVRVNDDKAIERFNKVYISMGDVVSVVDIKARSIAKEGTIIEVDKNNIKVMEKNENNGTYKIFAIDGLEKGSEVEYYYILKKEPAYFGREYMQNDIPIIHSRIEVISPETILFKAKSYNNFPALKDTVMKSKHFLTAEFSKIKGLHEEEYASYTSNLMRVESKLDRNLEKDDKELLTWQDAAQSIYKRVYLSYQSPNKKIDNIIKKELHLDKMDETAKIKAIENYIKTNYVLKEESGEGLGNLDNIIKNKYASVAGMVKLFGAFFTQADIKHELVLTTDRKELLFDKDFESWNFLENYLFYFPAEDKFISPTDFSYRYPLVPFLWTENDGLFIKKVVMGNYSMGYGEVKHIASQDADVNFNNHDITIKFNDDLSDATMHVKRSLGGLEGMQIQPYYNLVAEDKRKETVESLLKESEKDAKLSNQKVKNTDQNISPFYQPVIIEGDLQGTGFLDKAGNNYLFKLGMLIGPQSQLYEEKKRENPIMNDYNRRYDRDIVFNIPKGYKIKNISDLNMDVYHEKDGKRDYSFTSKYKIDGDKVIIRVEEFYKTIFSPLTDFESFRKVINASADFNKITLVFEKE